MHARFLEVKVKPEAVDQGLALEHQIVSFLKQMSGFRGVVTLIDRESGEVISVSYWETQEQTRQPMPYMTDLMPQLKQILVAEPLVKSYEVVVNELSS
jgi:quinol monooxygenase YgiN